jgi:hypothetical protein
MQPLIASAAFVAWPPTPLVGPRSVASTPASTGNRFQPPVPTRRFGTIQRRLAVSNLDKNAVDELIYFLNRIFAGKYKVEKGDVFGEHEQFHELSLKPVQGGQDKQLEPQAQRLHDVLNLIISDEGKVMVRLGLGNQNFPIAHFDNQALDIRDILAFGDPGMGGVNAAALLSHELWEQFQSQVKGKNYEAAHRAGIGAEEHILDLDRIGDYPRRVSERDLNDDREEVFIHGRGAKIIMSVSRITDNLVRWVNRFDVSADVIKQLPLSAAADPAAALKLLAHSDAPKFIKICENARALVQ